MDEKEQIVKVRAFGKRSLFGLAVLLISIAGVGYVVWIEKYWYLILCFFVFVYGLKVYFNPFNDIKDEQP